VVTAAILATRLAIEREAEQSYRVSFQPHGIVVCERTIPEPIWLAAVIGVERILRLDLTEGSPPVTYVQQALDGLETRLQRWSSSSLPAFGSPRSVVVNYAYDKAVEFDLDGTPLRVFDEAVRTGVSTLALSGRPLSSRELKLMTGQ
jgi:hypothetical protein